MPSSRVKDFVKDFGKVFAVRLTRPAKNGRTQPSSTTTHHEGDHSIPVDIPMHPGSLARDPGLEVSINISSVTSPRGTSFAREASDMAQTFLPFVQAVAGPIPVAGAPIKAAIGGVLEIFKAMDRCGQNKVDLDSLASTLDRLRDDLYNAPRAQDHLERSRRETLISILLETSDTLTELRQRSLAYPSVTLDIAGCFTKIDRYMAEYLWSSQMQSQHDIHEMLAILRRQQDSVGPAATQLTGAVALGCATLVDATGYEHPISVTFCTSYQQLNEIVQVLFKCDTIEARLQRWYMEQGQYDLCIDDDKQVTRLTSHEWQSIEPGTTIVMRVIFEQEISSRVDYRCHFCGAVNDVGAKSIMDSLQCQAGCSINCRVCKRRFQISRGSSSAKRSTQSSNIDSVPSTEAEMHLIRNFRVQQTSWYLRRLRFVKVNRFFLSKELNSRPVSKEARDFSAHGASATAYSHGNEFLDDGPMISPQPSHSFPSHEAEYEYNRIVEIEEDGNDDYDEDGAEDSDDALPADDGEDCEEWEDCKDGEEHEETN